jgi:thiamine biosynthesis lipoprotein
MTNKHHNKIKKILLILITLLLIIQPLLPVNAAFLYVDNNSINYLYKKTDSGYVKVSDEEKNQIIIEINTLLSDFENSTGLNVESSDTNKINFSATNIPIPISNYTVDLFILSTMYFETTQGAFNIATYNLTKLWGFSPDNSGYYNVSRIEPESEQILKAKALADVDLVVFEDEKEIYKGLKENYIILYNTDNPYLIKSNTDIKIDFGAIAKGYICDKAGDIIESHNINRGALKILSNIYLIGNRVIENSGEYSERNFTVNIENPRRTINNNSNCIYVENIKDKAITTSADNYRYYIYNNKIYSHIISPFTGKPTDNGIISVSVFTDTGAKADAYSTAGFVMGLKQAINFYTENQINAIIITSDYNYYVVGDLQVNGINYEDLFTYAKNEDAVDIIKNSYKEKIYLGLTEKNNINFSLILSALIIIITIGTVIFLIKKSEK